MAPAIDSRLTAVEKPWSWLSTILASSCPPLPGVK
jgi:hypothetical protein